MGLKKELCVTFVSSNKISIRHSYNECTKRKHSVKRRGGGAIRYMCPHLRMRTQREEGIHSALNVNREGYNDIWFQGTVSNDEGTDVEHDPTKTIHQGDDQELNGQSGLLCLSLGLLGGTR